MGVSRTGGRALQLGIAGHAGATLDSQRKTGRFAPDLLGNWLPYATPEWVRQAGAKGCFYEFGKGPTPQGRSWDPDFGDPVFLEKLGQFLSAMAARYDGNPNVAFIDIGSYGLWGEGHTMMSSRVPEADAPRIIRQHVDLYTRHFKRTLLCINDDVAGPEKPGLHFPETDYALSKGVALRDT